MSPASSFENSGCMAVDFIMRGLCKEAGCISGILGRGLRCRSRHHTEEDCRNETASIIKVSLKHSRNDC
jgi:hypothetical protein